MEPYCAKCRIPWSECPCDKEPEEEDEDVGNPFEEESGGAYAPGAFSE